MVNLNSMLAVNDRKCIIGCNVQLQEDVSESLVSNVLHAL